MPWARARQCALPEDVAARLVEQWGARLGAHGTSCKTILPRELTTAAFSEWRHRICIPVFIYAIAVY